MAVRGDGRPSGKNNINLEKSWKIHGICFLGKNVGTLGWKTPKPGKRPITDHSCWCGPALTWGSDKPSEIRAHPLPGFCANTPGAGHLDSKSAQAVPYPVSSSFSMKTAQELAQKGNPCHSSNQRVVTVVVKSTKCNSGSSMGTSPIHISRLHRWVHQGLEGPLGQHHMSGGMESTGVLPPHQLFTEEGCQTSPLSLPHSPTFSCLVAMDNTTMVAYINKVGEGV